MNKFYKWIAIADRHSKIHLDRMFAPLGINSSQHMFIIKVCENEGIGQDKLPAIVRINKSNVARALCHLEKSGFIRRVPNQEDRRSVNLFSTAKGREAYARIIRIEDDWAATLTDGFSQAEKTRLAEAMRRVAETAVREARTAQADD